MFDKLINWLKGDSEPTEKEAKDLTQKAIINYPLIRAVAKTKPGDEIDVEVLRQKLLEETRKDQETIKILDVLEIPNFSNGTGVYVSGRRLVEILSDEEKVKKIQSKLRLKAFW